MYEGQSTQDLSWAKVTFAIKCELSSPSGRQPREDGVVDDMILAAGAALTSQSHRFTNARQNGDHPDKRELSMKFGDEALLIEIRAIFELTRSITQDTLRAVLFQAVGPAVSMAAGNHFGKPSKQSGRQQIGVLAEIDELLTTGTGGQRRARVH
jgi:hypothetical protein